MENNRGGDNGDEDKDLWRRVTQTVRPYGRGKSRAGKAVQARAAAPAKTAAGTGTTTGRKTGTKAGAAGAGTPRSAPAFDAAVGRDLRRGRFAVEARLDLHGMTQAAAHAELGRFIDAARGRGLRTLLVITGKGLRTGGGVLRRLLPLWMEQAGMREKILAFSPARACDGGDGAWYIRLRKRPPAALP